MTISLEPKLPTTLYRLFDKAGDLLYVGVAGNPGRRFEQHRGDKQWWGDVARVEVAHFVTRTEAFAAETAAIRSEHPRHNITHNRRIAPRPRTSSATTLERREAFLVGTDVGPYPAGTRWDWRTRHGVDRSHCDLVLMWEPNGSTISDNYYAEDVDAYEMWRIWVRWLHDRDGWSRTRGKPWVDVLWMVRSLEGGVAEFAPFQQIEMMQRPRRGRITDVFDDGEGHEDFLTFYSWPEHAVTGEDVNWNRLPVVDQWWTDHDDIAGFIQEATGWKPSPLQDALHLPSVAQAARLRWQR